LVFETERSIVVGPNTILDSAIPFGSDLEIEAQGEIGILFFGDNVAAPFTLATQVNDSIINLPTGWYWFPIDSTPCRERTVWKEVLLLLRESPHGTQSE
jgi:hypothetical protein